jgi:hypothetical protein
VDEHIIVLVCRGEHCEAPAHLNSWRFDKVARPGHFREDLHLDALSTKLADSVITNLSSEEVKQDRHVTILVLARAAKKKEPENHMALLVCNSQTNASLTKTYD